VKLNLGSGDDYREGYVNIDLRDDCGADEVGDVGKLRFGDGEVDEIVAADLLEHFPAYRTLDVLAEWRRVLRPGGRLVLKVPNLLELARWIVDRANVRLVVRNIYGGHRWGPDGSWDAHHTGWTPDMLEEDLRAAGFRVLTNRGGVNMWVEAEAV
jgi:SAM-dependent methyltransferase